MYNMVFMQISKRPTQLENQSMTIRLLSFLKICQIIEQVTSLAIFHNDENVRIGVDDVNQLDNMAVMERLKDINLRTKLLNGTDVFKTSRGDDFAGELLRDKWMTNEDDDTGGAGANGPDVIVLAERLWKFDCRSVHGGFPNHCWNEKLEGF
jgi:hypothetical protein